MTPVPINADDFERLAGAALDDNAWAYFTGGAADELTLDANREAWRQLRLHPRVLRDLRGAHTGIRLLGRDWPHPMLVAPMAYQRLAHPDGEVAMAHAAVAQGAGLVLSAQASQPMEAVAQAMLSEPGRGPLWFQLYLQPDAGANRALVQRAEAAGFEALVLTVDAPVHGARDRERRAGFRLPPGVSAVNLPPPVAPAGGEGLCGGLLAQAPTWADVEALAASTRLPLLLKGVLHEDDARQAQRLGVAGLVVSNHGGRTLDTVPATAEVLPRIADALGGALPLLVDGGLRRGTDILKALALGADAVLVGRPAIHALAAGGPLGVAQLLRLLRDELEIAMALTGTASLTRVPRDVLFSASPTASAVTGASPAASAVTSASPAASAVTSASPAASAVTSASPAASAGGGAGTSGPAAPDRRR